MKIAGAHKLEPAPRWLITAAILASLISPYACGRAAEALAHRAQISFDSAGVLVVDGKKRFPVNLTVVPGPEARAPNGRAAYAEFADCGVMFMRTGAPQWNDEAIEKEKATQAAAAANGLRCCPWLGWDLSNFETTDREKQARLRKVIAIFKDSPGMGLWKGADEPDWSNSHNPKTATPEQVAHVAKIIHDLDPSHPIWLVQAPRGTVSSLKRYDSGWDVGGIDIYPVSYPPGLHSEGRNKEISMVGDFARMMKQVAGEKPFWMTLQIAFSGVVKPGRTLRFPTFPEQRFMAYQSIINGARGLTWFGGGLPQTLNERDKPLAFNWTYFDRVMRPLLEEFGPKSPILAALLAPDSTMKLKVISEPVGSRNASADASAVEYLVREAEGSIYVLACKREGPTTRIRFSGLPKTVDGKDAGTVLFEEPRKVDAQSGSFADWFGPFDVHVYRFKMN